MADIKQTLAQRTINTPFGQFPVSRRALGSRTSFASVKYFHYSKQNFGTSSNLEQGTFTEKQLYGVNVGVIEEEIASMKVSKSLSGTGTFELHLHPTKNWKKLLSPGDWIVIYMFDRYKSAGQKDDNSQNLIMLGNIDRVARSLQKGNETDDKVKLSYTVSGRSFRKVLEETDIWFDPNAVQVKTLDIMLRTAGLEITGNPSTMVKTVLDVFLGPGGTFGKGSTAPLGQWRIPKELSKIFGVDTFATGLPLFYDILKRNIRADMPGFKVRQMLSPESSASVWNMVERSSNSLVNEVFVEEVRDSEGRAFPTLVHRPKPLNTPSFNSTAQGESQFGSEDGTVRPLLKGSYQTLQDLSTKSFIEISPAEVLYEDLGKDEHSRLNMFWLRVQQAYEYAYSKAANLKTGLTNPTFSRPSITRYGLKRFDQVLDFSFVEGKEAQADQAPDPNINLFKAFMAQVYDMNYANHLYDSGTISCTGVLEAELGKALVLPSDPTNESSRTKIFYIEGYTHEWQFPSTWRTTFTVTHGQFRDKNGNIFIDCVGPGDFGQEESLITTAYLSKTKTDRK